MRSDRLSSAGWAACSTAMVGTLTGRTAGGCALAGWHHPPNSGQRPAGVTVQFEQGIWPSCIVVDLVRQGPSQVDEGGNPGEAKRPAGVGVPRGPWSHSKPRGVGDNDMRRPDDPDLPASPGSIRLQAVTPTAAASPTPEVWRPAGAGARTPPGLGVRPADERGLLLTVVSSRCAM